MHKDHEVSGYKFIKAYDEMQFVFKEVYHEAIQAFRKLFFQTIIIFNLDNGHQD